MDPSKFYVTFLSAWTISAIDHQEKLVQIRYSNKKTVFSNFRMEVLNLVMLQDYLKCQYMS